MDAHTQTLTTSPADVDAPAASAGAPFEFVEFRTTSADWGMWVNVQGGEAVVAGAGCAYFAPREPCRLRHRAPNATGKWRACGDTGADPVSLNIVAYVTADVED